MPASVDGPQAQTTYRALILHQDGAVLSIQDLVAADDDEAIALAKAMVDGHAVELWDGLRFIEHFALAASAFDG